jgi:hypothetical protein
MVQQVGIQASISSASNDKSMANNSLQTEAAAYNNSQTAAVANNNAQTTSVANNNSHGNAEPVVASEPRIRSEPIIRPGIFQLVSAAATAMQETQPRSSGNRNKHIGVGKLQGCPEDEESQRIVYAEDNQESLLF